MNASIDYISVAGISASLIGIYNLNVCVNLHCWPLILISKVFSARVKRPKMVSTVTVLVRCTVSCISYHSCISYQSIPTKSQITAKKKVLSKFFVLIWIIFFVRRCMHFILSHLSFDFGSSFVHFIVCTFFCYWFSFFSSAVRANMKIYDVFVIYSVRIK